MGIGFLRGGPGQAKAPSYHRLAAVVQGSRWTCAHTEPMAQASAGTLEGYDAIAYNACGEEIEQ